MPKLLSALTGKTSSATLFEIRLTKDVIVLHGDRDSAASQIMTGVVMLCLHQTLKVEEVYLKMSGTLKISWPERRYHQETDSNMHVQRHCEIFHHRWPPFIAGAGPGSSSRGSILHPGNYEWPFDLIIPGTMAESVHGLPETNIIYKLKATVARGKLAHDLHAWKSVRIVRILDLADSELAQPMSVENVWPNKIEYSVMVPQKAIILGTAVDVEMKFAILIKGLRIGNIRCQIFELIDLVAGSLSRPEIMRSYKNERLIGTWNFQITNQNYRDILFENGQDGHILTEKLPLPKSLNECRQDCDVHGIKVRHKVKFNVSLHNPDGHLSELRATIPITLLSPCSSFAANGELTEQNLDSAHTAGILRHAPPLYADHVLDLPYAGIYQSGVMTPVVQSGMNTPVFSRSRAGSFDNLASMEGNLSPNSMAIGAVPPAALSSRLQNISFSSRNSSFRRLAGLGSSGANTPHIYPNTETDQPVYFDSYFRSEYQHNSGNNSANNSGHNSLPQSRRSSGDAVNQSRRGSGWHTCRPSNISDLEELSKVPSYRTIEGMNNNDLPNYETVLSTPPSPSLESNSPRRMSTPINSVANVEGHTNGTINFIPSSPNQISSTTVAISPLHPISDVSRDRRRFLTIPNRGRSAT